MKIFIDSKDIPKKKDKNACNKIYLKTLKDPEFKFSFTHLEKIYNKCIIR